MGSLKRPRPTHPQSADLTNEIKNMTMTEREKTALRAWFNPAGDLVWSLRSKDRKTWQSLREKGLAGRTDRPAQLGLSALGLQARTDIDAADAAETHNPHADPECSSCGHVSSDHPRGGPCGAPCEDGLPGDR